MKKVLQSISFLIISIMLSTNLAIAQNDWCLTEHMYQEAVKNDISVLRNRELLEVETAAYLANNPEFRSTGVPKIIPVVFHVIHEGGAENISKAQMLDQIEKLNMDMRRLNADTVNTPGPFKPLAGDTNIEFKVATKDPNGNCTDGIVRVFSTLTNNARNNVKALSYWPSNKYLNIWIVKTIENVNGGAGFVIGFAQFPGGSALTDGVVLRADYTGTIGTASPSNKGRTATHEVGHWLNLRHIWGDATCGDDLVSDTPVHAGANQSNCPTFPKTSNCVGNGANGDMFTNYMDYTTGSCQNMFSIGQAARIDAAMNSSISGRNNLWSAGNLVATGTDGSTPQLCVPVADFASSATEVCEGTNVTFTDGSWNGDVANWNWSFPGGTPSSSTAPNPLVTYSTAGTYTVTLTVSNATGSATKTKSNHITVSSATATNNVPFAEGFENITFPGSDYSIINESGNAWASTSLAAYNGTKSVYLNNFSGNASNSIDAFTTPAFDLTNVASTMLKFKMAFAVRSTASTDLLRVLVSTTCGQFWTQRYTKSGTTLATSGLVTSNYAPSSQSQWREETVNLSSLSFSGKPNVKFKFEYTQDTGNNLFIDDINLDGLTGLNDNNAISVSVTMYPNPATTYTTINFTLDKTEKVTVKLYDLLGRELQTLAEGTLPPGEYQKDITELNEKGVYLVKLFVGGQAVTSKLVVQ